MNFIDTAMAEGDNLSEDAFLQAMADIYKEPEVWDILDKYPQYIQDVIYIIDYDTELQMEGLEWVLEDCGHKPEKYEKMHSALVNAGALVEARILHEAHVLYESWLLGSGEKDEYEEQYYEQMEKLQSQTALYNDYESFWDLVRDYIRKNRILSF